MVNRLMDLVVLVAELSQKDGKSFRELDKELVHQGYSVEEVEQAIAWMASQWHPSDTAHINQFDSEARRVLSPWETLSLDSDAHGYLLRLQTLGIIDSEQFERILARIMPFAAEKFTMNDVKALAGSVIFNLGADLSDDALFHVIDDEIQVT